jgi:aminopeptidase YwaD
MTLRAFAVVALAFGLASGGCRSIAAPRAAASLEPAIPPAAERAYQAVDPRFDERGALDVVTFMSRFWRIAGNPGYDASIDHIRERLQSAGFANAPGVGAGWMRVDEHDSGNRGWDYEVGTVTLADGPDDPVLSRERDRVSLCINSFSTPAGGLVVPLVDVGAGTDQDFAGKDLRGTVVLGDAPIGRLWQQAVKARGAAGVISTAIAPYIRPADPAGFTREEQKDVLQWGSIPYDPAARAFGFKASWRAASRLRDALKAGPTRVRVNIRSSFQEGPNRSLVAEIPGRTRPAERIVLVAHVQEPGANDDASGCATLYGIAKALVEAIREGALPPPDRTITFMWVDEIRGSRHWLSSRPDEARGVQYMFSLDMTGEDTAKTGGTFLIEKQPDPTAVWERPSDPHSEWGAGDVDPESLKGSLLNDLHIAVCLRRARDTGWTVRTNPYEGGSDHTAFGSAGVPSLLNWHFTDRYYHTNQDTPDKVSAAEMANVGVSVASSVWALASADEADALDVVDLLEAAARRRLALERTQGRALVAAAADQPAAEARERAVVAAWLKWYGEAFDSVLSLPANGAGERLRARVHAARAGLE